MKKVFLIGLALLAVIVIAALVLPPLVDLGSYKSRYLPLVEGILQRKLDVGEVRLRLIPAPSIQISRPTVADSPAFSQDAFFSARQISLRLKFWPLLRGHFQADELVIEKPVINLVKQPNGVFNFSDIARGKEISRRGAEPKKGEPERLSDLLPARARIEDGELSVGTVGEAPCKIRGLNLLLKDFSAERSFFYRIAVGLLGVEPISLEGSASYQESEATLRLAENHFKAQQVDFAVNGTIRGLTDVAQVEVTLENPEFDGKPIIQILAAAGLWPKDLEVSGRLGLKAALTGSFSRLFSSASVDLKGLKVRHKRVFEAALEGEMLLSSPLGGDAPVTQTLRGNGKLAARDGALTSVDLAAKIQLLTGLAGMPQGEKSGATSFRTLESEFVLGNGVADIRNLFLASPLMEARGGGKVTLADPSLDLRIEAALDPALSGRLAGGKTAAFFKDSQGRIVMPLRVTGAVDSPSVSLDSVDAVKRGIGRLFEQFFKGR